MKRLILALFAVSLTAQASAQIPAITPTTETSSLLPGTNITISSTEQHGVLSAEITSTLATPFSTVAASLAQMENWCQFMPLHFNVKACTYQTRQDEHLLTLYSGRKSYQTPSESYSITYSFVVMQSDEHHLSLQLYAAHGPAGTSDYRIEVEATRSNQGTLLHISSAYHTSITSSLLTRSYLATLGRDKVGFSHVANDSKNALVQGVRGVIERNVMRYQLAMVAFLDNRTLPQAIRHETLLRQWFNANEHYALQLHEMDEADYMKIKQGEWANQQQLQQALNEQQGTVALR